MRLTFFVQERTTEPRVGDPAPRSEQAVFTGGLDVRNFTTADPPNPDLVDTTIADAIDSGEPVVVAFVTPAFCQTRFCGPVLSVTIQPLYEELGDVVEFIQWEPYVMESVRDGAFESAPTVTEWGLQAEPFVFVLAPGGTVGQVRRRDGHH